MNITFTQLVVTVAFGTMIPTITVLAGILVSHSRLNDINGRLIHIEADLREFYRTLGDHGARIENLEKRAK